MSDSVDNKQNVKMPVFLHLGHIYANVSVKQAFYEHWRVGTRPKDSGLWPVTTTHESTLCLRACEVSQRSPPCTTVRVSSRSLILLLCCCSACRDTCICSQKDATDLTR